MTKDDIQELLQLLDFEPNGTVYTKRYENVGEPLKDLKSVDNDTIQKKYNEFALILRQHNVGGYENAFDKLVNLFLAKVVDETSNPVQSD